MGGAHAWRRVVRRLAELRALPRRGPGRARLPVRRPAHQGRGAEGVFFGAIIDPGEIVPSNAHFDTTRAHIEIRGGVALDLPVDGALDPGLDAPFKGDMDVDALVEVLDGPDGERVSIVMLTITNNTAGGQPVSLANINEVARVTREHGKKFVMDIARFAENAWFVARARGPRGEPARDRSRAGGQGGRDPDEREKGCDREHRRLRRDPGGRGLLPDPPDAGCRERGLSDVRGPRAAGISTRSRRGLREVLDEEYLRHRVEQVAYLGQVLSEAGAAVVLPTGGHAVYVDAGATLPHVPPEEFPRGALSCGLYLAGGVRAAEIGSVMAGRDPESGDNRHPPLELLRLAVPRRVYTSRQLEHAADAMAEIVRDPESVRGFAFEYEAEVLRHFTARFRPLDPALARLS